MPRRAPPPDLKPTRTSIALPKKVFMATAKTVDPEKPEVEDFSAVLKVALTEYLERHHPGLIEATAKEIREMIYMQAGPKELKVADGKQAKGAGLSSQLAAQYLPPPSRKRPGPNRAPRK